MIPYQNLVIGEWYAVLNFPLSSIGLQHSLTIRKILLEIIELVSTQKPSPISRAEMNSRGQSGVRSVADTKSGQGSL